MTALGATQPTITLMLRQLQLLIFLISLWRFFLPPTMKDDPIMGTSPLSSTPQHRVPLIIDQGNF